VGRIKKNLKCRFKSFGVCLPLFVGRKAFVWSKSNISKKQEKENKNKWM